MGAYVSLHGRAYGYDSETGATIRNGSEGNFAEKTVSAASTATNISPRGLTTIATSTATKAFTLDAPIPGLVKTLTVTGGSSLGGTVTASTGTYGTTAGSARAPPTHRRARRTRG